MIGDRVKANPLERDTGLHGTFCLIRDITVPRPTPLILDAGFCNQNRLAITRVGFGKDPAQRLVAGMTDVDRRPAMDPLVVEIVVDANDIEKPLLTSSPAACGRR